jgi:hypothetical protein
MDSRQLTEEEVDLYRETFMRQANQRMDDGLPSTGFARIEWVGGKPKLGPTQSPDSEGKPGERRYTLYDLSNGDFRL